jgi:hypothetical protein
MQIRRRFGIQDDEDGHDTASCMAGTTRDRGNRGRADREAIAQEGRYFRLEESLVENLSSVLLAFCSTALVGRRDHLRQAAAGRRADADALELFRADLTARARIVVLHNE